MGLKNQILGLKSQKIIRRDDFCYVYGKKMRLPKKVDKKLEGNEVKYCDFRDF